MLRGLVCNKEKLFHTKVEMITHSVHTFRNCSVVHDLSTSKIKRAGKKQILKLKQQQL